MDLEGRSTKCFKVVAKELKDTGTYEIEPVGFYDIIKAGTVSLQTEHESAFKQGTVPAEITVAELLTGVNEEYTPPDLEGRST